MIRRLAAAVAVAAVAAVPAAAAGPGSASPPAAGAPAAPGGPPPGAGRGSPPPAELQWAQRMGPFAMGESRALDRLHPLLEDRQAFAALLAGKKSAIARFGPPLAALGSC